MTLDEVRRTVLCCPLAECGWFVPLPDPGAEAVVPAGRLGEYAAALRDFEPGGDPFAEAVFGQLLRQYLAVDETVRAHLATHSLLEWVQEVTRLRDELAAEKSARGHVCGEGAG